MYEFESSDWWYHKLLIKLDNITAWVHRHENLGTLLYKSKLYCLFDEWVCQECYVWDCWIENNKTMPVLTIEELDALYDDDYIEEMRICESESP